MSEATWLDYADRYGSNPKDLPILWELVRTGGYRPAFVLGVFFKESLLRRTTDFCLTIHEVYEWLGGSIGVRILCPRLVEMGYLGRRFRSPIELMTLLCSGDVHPDGKHCSWCKKETRYTENHHWPLSSKNGGVDVVRICKPCHVDYHAMERSPVFYPTRMAEDLFRRQVENDSRERICA